MSSECLVAISVNSIIQWLAKLSIRTSISALSQVPNSEVTLF